MHTIEASPGWSGSYPVPLQTEILRATSNSAALMPVLSTTFKLTFNPHLSKTASTPRKGSMTATVGMPTGPFTSPHIWQVKMPAKQYNQLHMTGTALLRKELPLLTKGEEVPEGRGLTVTSLLSQLFFLGSPGREATEVYCGSEAEPEACAYQKQNHENRQLSGHALHQHFMGSYRLPKTSYLQTKLVPTMKVQSW